MSVGLKIVFPDAEIMLHLLLIMRSIWMNEK